MIYRIIFKPIQYLLLVNNRLSLKIKSNTKNSFILNLNKIMMNNKINSKSKSKRNKNKSNKNINKNRNMNRKEDR